MYTSAGIKHALQTMPGLGIPAGADISVTEHEEMAFNAGIKEVDLAMIREFVGRSLDAGKSEDFILSEIRLAATRPMLSRQYFSDFAQDYLLPAFIRK